MKTSLAAVVLFVLMIASTGCVSQKQYDDCRAMYLTSAQRVAELEAQVAELNETIEQMRRRGMTGSETLLSLTTERDRLAQELSAAQAEIARLQRTRVQVLSPELESALKQFAQRYAAIASYDPITGAVKFKSDLTFALGSADLSAAAKQGLAGLAEVFNSPEAAGYEVRIVGHTDNVKIKKPATLEKHPTNWHLSVHRAIAVRDALHTAGVADNRTSVAGYGEFRPVVANGARGAEQNRRVEIYLVPMTAPLAPAPAPEAPGADADDAMGSAAPAAGAVMSK